MTKKAGVGCKQSFALYGGNDKLVLTDNPPFFCFDLTSLAHPSRPAAVWMDDTVWKRGMEASKRWVRERKRKIEWSHPHELFTCLMNDLIRWFGSCWSHSLWINHWFSPIGKHCLINCGTYYSTGDFIYFCFCKLQQLTIKINYVAVEWWQWLVYSC